MQTVKSPKSKYWVMELGPYQTQARLSILAALTVGYVLVFHPLVDFVGPVGAALITVPVFTTGLFFGISAGLLAGIVGIALSAFLQTIFSGSNPSYWLINFWPGNLMVLIAGPIAGYVHHVLAERVQINNALYSRERFLSLISLATKSILAPRNPEDAYYSLITHLTNLFVADYAYLIRWDDSRNEAILVAATIPQTPPLSSVILGPDEAAVVKHVLETGRILIIDDIPNSGYIVNPGPFRESSFPTRTALCIPLAIRDYKFGAITIAFDDNRHFTRDEASYIEVASNQLALALWTHEQDQEIIRKLKEADALSNIGRALSETERVGIETVLQLIIDSARELIPGTEEAVIHLLDEEQEVLIPRAVAGIDNPNYVKLNMRLGEGVAGQVIAEGITVNIADVENDPRFLRQTTRPRFRSLMVSPVESGGHRLGTISVQSSRRNTFSREAQRLLSSLGTQAGIAIENAHLFETTQQGLKEINALFHITQGLVASLDTEHLMKDVVELLHESFGYQAQIFVLDPETGDMILRQGTGEVGERLKNSNFRLPAGTGIVGHVAETVRPFFTNNVEEVVFYVPQPFLTSIRSELAVPIKLSDKVLGVIDIQQIAPGRLTERDMQLVGTVADQLAVALQKANLYSDLQQALVQEKNMRSQLIQSERLALVGRLLASVSHELNNPLQAIQNALFLIKDESGLSQQSRQDLDIILSETERMAALIERLRAAYRPIHAEDFQLVDINNIIEDVHTLTATHMRHKEISFEFHPDPDLPVIAGLSDQLRQVVLNLFLNAVEAMPPGGCLSIETRSLRAQNEILISVEDTGPGIDPQILPQIFDAFITNKITGTGLGLTITQDVVQQHHGRIEAENRPQGGAAFHVWLPVRGKDEV